jgi:hypothetical protein
MSQGVSPSFLRSGRRSTSYCTYNLREKYSTRTRHASTFFCSIFLDQLRPKLNNVLQCLSLNGYSVFSLIDDILACCNLEDERIKTLHKWMERDAADICVRLLSLITSGPERVFGRVKCTCSSSSSGWRVLSCVHSQESQPCSADRRTPGQCFPGHLQLLYTRPYCVSTSTCQGLAKFSSRLPKMARNHICVTTPARSTPKLLIRNTRSEESSFLARHLTSNR